MTYKKFLVPVLTLVVGSTMVLGATTYVSAQEGVNPTTTLVQRIAERFGLKTEDVQAVFDEHHSEMHIKMQVKIEDKLNGLVSEGKLTAAQREAILGKHKELLDSRESMRESLRSLTPEQRRAEMRKKKTDLEDWAKEQNIDLSVLEGMVFVHKGFHKGFMR